MVRFDSRPVQINVYELDYALLKTPVANSELYDAETLKMLQRPMVNDQLSWFRSADILSEVTLMSAHLWNDALVSLVKEDMTNSCRIPVLYVKRFPCKAFQDAVSDLLKDSGLKFWGVSVSINPSFFKKLTYNLMASFPNCTEFSYYSSDPPKGLSEYMQTRYPNVDYFEERCARVSCLLDPPVELQLMKKLVRAYNLGVHKDLTINISRFGLALKFSISDRQRLLRIAFSSTGEPCLPSDLGTLQLSLNEVPLCSLQKEYQMVKQLFGSTGRVVDVVAEELGSVPNTLYAVRFSCGFPGISFRYGESAVAVLATNDTKHAAQNKNVQSIGNWTPIIGSVESRTFHPTVQYDRKIRIKSREHSFVCISARPASNDSMRFAVPVWISAYELDSTHFIL